MLILIFTVMDYFLFYIKTQKFKLKCLIFKNSESMQEYFKKVEVYELKNENAEEYKKRHQYQEKV